MLGFNGQRKSSEIGTDAQTAEFWEYNGDVGRRWNIDPITKESESPYLNFSGNPILNIDPNGNSDSIYKTPGGGTITIDDPNAETYDGRSYKIGNTTVQPEKGTLRSFTVTGEHAAKGAARFVAMFNKKTGAFTGYGWDKKPSYTYDDFVSEGAEDYLRNLEHANDPMWDATLSREQAKRNFINNNLGVAIPNVLIRPLTIATVAQKIFPRGFSSAKQFAQAGSELESALQKSGIEYSSIGVRGSAVTNISSKGGAFRQTAIGNLKASDIDVFVEFKQTSGLRANTSGFVHPDKLLKNFPELKSWSEKWSKILGREITPGGWNPGVLKDGNLIKF